MEGGGLECVYGDGGQPENREHHQWVCESMVGTTGGRELGKDEEALVRCHFPRPWSIVPSCLCKRNVGGQAVVARHWSNTYHRRQPPSLCRKTRRRRGPLPGGPHIYLGAGRSGRGSQELGK